MTSGKRRRPMRPLGILCSTALTGTVLLSAVQTIPAHAQALYGAEGGGGDSGFDTSYDGGAGGGADEAGNDAVGAGGAAGIITSPDGGDGADGFGAGGGGGGGGGGGYSNIVSGNISTPYVGGNGGGGGDGGGSDPAMNNEDGDGGGGGGGGDGVRNGEANPDISVRANIRGGNGGNGGNTESHDGKPDNGSGGGGGGGGAGLVLQNKGVVAIGGTVTVDGGDGGDGGDGDGNSSDDHVEDGGGGGGAGVILNLGGDLTNSGDISGGAGGQLATGGAGVVMGDSGSVDNDGGIVGGAGGVGAPGGAAIDLKDGGTVVNSGTITGGAGTTRDPALSGRPSGGTGSGGAPGFVPSATSADDGGAGIVGAGVNIVNSSIISGGLGGDGMTRADAIQFTGGVNRLELHAGSDITGNVDATTGADDTFALGGAANDTFDLSAIGATAQYRGFEQFEKTGAGVWILTGTTTAATPWTVKEGMLQFGDGTLGGAINVQAGGRLAGSGTVGDTDVSGIIAPGNSIGILTIAGDYTQLAGSTYEVEIEPGGASDLIDVTETATIAGEVFVLKAPGGYGIGTRYTILTADGGVTGVYDTLDQNAPFVGLALAYDPNNVYLDVTRNSASFCDVAATSNQCAAGNGAGSAGVGDPVHDAIAVLPDAEAARAAFDLLSGEIHASARSALIENSRFARDAAGDRLRAAFNAGAPSSMPVMSFAPAGVAPAAAADTGRVAVWAQGYGSWGSFDGDGNAAELDTSTGGFVTGIDGAVAPNIRLGLLAGYGQSSFDADDRASSGSGETYHLGLYGGGRWGAVRLTGGLAYAWHDLETDRSVAFPGFSDDLSADYDAGAVQMFGEAAYGIDTAVALFEPFVELAYVSLHTDGFTEQGGAAALSVSSDTTDSVFATPGLRASTGFTLGGMQATARGMLGWRHAFGDTTPLSIHAFAAGDAFTVAGTPIAENAAVIRAGFDLDITDNATLGLSYAGQIASDAREHGVTAELTVKF